MLKNKGHRASKYEKRRVCVFGVGGTVSKRDVNKDIILVMCVTLRTASPLRVCLQLQVCLRRGRLRNSGMIIEKNGAELRPTAVCNTC